MNVKRCGVGAYTLLEVMVVLMLLGVLLAVAVPAYRAIRANAQRHEAEGRVTMLATAIRQLAWDTGMWPGHVPRNIQGDSESWDLTTAAAGLLRCDSGYTDWRGPYLPSISPDPWGSPYFFDPDYTTGGRVRAVVGSFGPNREGPNDYDSDDIIVILK